jgi:sporulation protein YlmC with PRC-barrel domain
MKTKTMTAASALALMIAFPVHAESVYANEQNTTMSQDVKQGLQNTDNAMRETADDIKAFFVGDEADNRMKPALIRRNMTANGLIGSPVLNANGERIATIKDIIIGKNGRAALAVVSDDGLLGIGSKVAAFDYNRVVTQRYDGTVGMTLSQEMIDRAADFSYDQKDWAKAKVMPAGAVSTNMLLDGDVLDSKGNKVASIDNVYFRNADAAQVVVGFNKTFGLGGDAASIDYDEVRMIRKDDTLDFKLSDNQSAQFKRFKTSVAN